MMMMLLTVSTYASTPSRQMFPLASERRRRRRRRKGGSIIHRAPFPFSLFCAPKRAEPKNMTHEQGIPIRRRAKILLILLSLC